MAAKSQWNLNWNLKLAKGFLKSHKNRQSSLAADFLPILREPSSWTWHHSRELPSGFPCTLCAPPLMEAEVRAFAFKKPKVQPQKPDPPLSLQPASRRVLRRKGTVFRQRKMHVAAIIPQVFTEEKINALVGVFINILPCKYQILT